MLAEMERAETVTLRDQINRGLAEARRNGILVWLQKKRAEEFSSARSVESEV